VQFLLPLPELSAAPVPITKPHGNKTVYARRISERLLNSLMYNPIMTAVNPTSRVKAAALRFKEPLLVHRKGFSLAMKQARN